MKHGWLAAGILTWCAVFIYLLVPPAGYAPGPLMQAHASFEHRCDSCHTPWHGLNNQACISCHGDFLKTNPHATVRMAGRGGELAAGKSVANFSNRLRCLSCHTEHLGRDQEVRASATFACAWCHKHPSIDQVARHKAPMIRPSAVKTMFAHPFSHSDHESQMAVDSLDCHTCHELTPTTPLHEMKFSIKWKGCTGGKCHANPQEIGMPDSIGKAPDTISNPVPLRHINAIFTHSPGHLRSKCADCHTKIEQSDQETDTEARTVLQCFTCHAHQPTATNRGQSIKVSFIATTANAAAQDDGAVTACGACHPFHRHGPEPTFDFATNPPKSTPVNMAKLHAIAVYGVDFSSGGILFGGRPLKLWAWWPGLFALLAIGVAAIGSWRILPALFDFSHVVGEGPFHRMHEVAALDDQYQSSIPGLFIIGEAGGTASINFAMRSGREVVSVIANQLRYEPMVEEPDLYDVVIVGCGPAGLGATATAASLGLKYCTLEKMTPASTIRTFPRMKFVQATPIGLEEYGSFFLEGDNSKDDLIAEWEKIIAHLELAINDREEVVDIRSERGRFSVITASHHIFKARSVILAIGSRGTPRHLELSGERPGRVFYHLIEPGEFTNKRILVVGGGNAGAEITQSLAAPELGNKVTYSIRGPALSGVTRQNAEKISALQMSNAIKLYPSTVLTEIRAGAIVLRPTNPKAGASTAADIVLENDVIFAMIGAEPPTRFLKSIGVQMTTKGAA
jgi:thioredoxin reductase (NADPH)